MKRNTAILVAIALACGLGVAIVELGPLRVKQQQQQQEAQLLEISSEEVTAVELIEGEETIALKKDTLGNWQLSQPLESAAEPTTVQGLINTLTIADAPTIASEEEGEPIDLQDFGLAQPERRILLHHSSGTVSIGLGQNTFDHSGLYLQVDDGPVRILDAGLAPQLSPSLFSLRDKTLVDWTVGTLQTFEIVSPDSTITLEKADNNWQLSDRPEVPLSTADVTDTLSQVSYLQANQFIAETQDDLVTYGLDNPSLQLAATLEDGSVQTVAIGDPLEDDPDSLYAISSERNTVVALSASTIESMATTELELRDRSLGPMSSGLIGEIAFTADDESLNRSLSPATSPDSAPDDWEISDQPDRLVSVESFLTPLRDARADGFIPAADATVSQLLDNPPIVITLQPQEGVANDPLILEFAPGEDELYARTSHNSEILVFDRQFYELLKAAIATFKPQN